MKLRRFWLPLGLLVAINAGGAYVRLVDLGKPDFHNDELYHLYAAEALGRGDGAVLPSGAPYRRGVDVTHMVGLSMRLIDRPETAARIPSALFGILNVIVFAAVAWAIGGPWVAVWSALLLAIYPEAVTQSRHTRFYTYQLTFGLVALYAGWHAVRTAGRPRTEGPARAILRREWTWVLVTVLAFVLALRVQLTTLSVVAAWGVCLAVAASADLAVRGRSAWRDSARVQAVVAGLAGLALLLAVRPSIVPEVLERSQSVAAWASGQLGDPRTYYWELSTAFPAVLALFPVCVAVVAFRKARLALFLLIWFSVPFLIHSFLLPWKSERYMLLAMPAFFLTAAIGATVGCEALFRRTRTAGESLGMPRGGSSVLAGALVATVAAFAVVTTPAFNTARKIPPFPKGLNWRAALAKVQALPGHESMAIGSSYPINSLYYWGRVDLGVTTASMEGGLIGESYEGAPVGSGVADLYTAVPIITRPDAIRDRFPNAPAALIAIDPAHTRFGNLTPQLTETLSSEAVELCDGACGQLLLYYWPLRGAAVEGTDGGARDSAPPFGVRRSPMNRQDRKAIARSPPTDDRVVKER